MAWKLRATGGIGGMVADAEEVKRAVALFAQTDGFFELRSLTTGVHRTVWGDDLDGIVAAINELPSGIGIYFIVNPLKEGLVKAATNADVTERRLIYIDIDPVKPEEFKDNPATDQEKAAAGSVADSVIEYLRDRGWPAPIVTDSGNGYGLFYRCQLPNDPLVKSALQNLLRSLDAKFSNSSGKIDKAVHNAARLAKLPGTWAKKGTQSDDRPHRPCKILSVPQEFALVSYEDILAASQVTEKAPKPSVNGTHKPTDGAYGRKALDLECARVSLTGQGARNDILNKAAFNLGQLVAGGDLFRQDVEDRLFDAACSSGLDKDPDCGERGIRNTIRSGIEAGAKSPRSAPERNDPRAVMGPNPVPEGEIILWAKNVRPCKVEWLWPGRIPLGKLTTFAGNGGLGKTFVLCDVISRVSQGSEWPNADGVCADRGMCLFISGEDDPEDTLVPRMMELGADLSKVAFLRTEVLNKFTLRDLPTLDKAIEQMGNVVRFVAIDPPTAYLGGVDDHKNAELRGLLSPLMMWAKKHMLSIVFNTHVNKPQGAKVEAMMRVMGSVAWVNAMRSAYMFAKDPDAPLERRLFVGMKNNLGKEKKGLAYRIAETETLARVEWMGEVETTADDAVNQNRETRKRSVVASEWLADLFAATDDIPSKTIYKRAKAETKLSDDALREAKDEMGIKASQKYDGELGRQWVWTWPVMARSAWKDRVKSDGQDEGVR